MADEQTDTGSWGDGVSNWASDAVSQVKHDAKQLSDTIYANTPDSIKDGVINAYSAVLGNEPGMQPFVTPPSAAPTGDTTALPVNPFTTQKPAAPVTPPAPTGMELAHAALICGYTAKDAPRQMTDADLARYFGVSTNIIGARPDAFYRRWVIKTTRDALPDSPVVCRAILDDPRNAPAIVTTMLANRKPNAPAAVPAGAQSDTPLPAGPDADKNSYASVMAVSPHIMEINNKGNEIAFRQPQGSVSKEEISKALAEIHNMRRAGGLSMAEENALLSTSFQLITRASTEGFMSPEEVRRNPEFIENAVRSVGVSGGGIGYMKMMPRNSAGLILPRTNSPHVPEVEGIGPPVVAGAIPNAKSATIDMKKFSRYALDTTSSNGGHKARVFQSALGYNQSNAGELRDKIQSGVTQNKAVPGTRDKYGRRFTVDMQISGPNGNTAWVRTGWIFDPGKTKARLTTAYVK